MESSDCRTRKENGKILTNEYLIVNEIEELIGLFSCENGEVFLKSSPIYSIWTVRISLYR